MAPDRTPDQGDEAAKPYPWRKLLLCVGSSIAYMIPLFWLWDRIGWPEGFGITITAHGKVGLFENYYYSYLLLQRPSPLDDATFLYMWAPVVAFVGWLGWAVYVTYRGKGAGRDDGDLRS